MKVFLLVFLCGLLTYAHASAGSTTFQDSFRAFLDMRKLEEQTSLLAARTDLEPEAMRTQLQALSARLTQARIDFHSILPEEQSDTSPWELQVLRRLEKNKAAKEPKTADPEALAFLKEAYPTASSLSAFEWQVISEFFGTATQRDFLDSTFAIHAEPAATKEKTGKRFAVWVNTPAFPILSKQDQARQKSERAIADRKLAALGYQTEEINVSPFIRMEDQAEDLQKLLKSRLKIGEFVLLSHGAASAVLFRAFDLYPDLLAREEILGWVNMNGKLFGIAHDTSVRKPASLKKISAADRQELDVRQEFLRLRQERLERQAPLGAKFPVLNVVTMGGAYRPAANLRESMVPEGKTLFLRGGNDFSGIEAALPFIAP